MYECNHTETVERAKKKFTTDRLVKRQHNKSFSGLRRVSECLAWPRFVVVPFNARTDWLTGYSRPSPAQWPGYARSNACDRTVPLPSELTDGRTGALADEMFDHFMFFYFFIICLVRCCDTAVRSLAIPATVMATATAAMVLLHCEAASQAASQPGQAAPNNPTEWARSSSLSVVCVLHRCSFIRLSFEWRPQLNLTIATTMQL